MFKTNLCGLAADEIYDLIEPMGYSYLHAVSISNSIYKKSISDISGFPKIPLRLKERLVELASCGIYGPLDIEISTDKSVKYLFRTEAGRNSKRFIFPGIKEIRFVFQLNRVAEWDVLSVLQAGMASVEILQQGRLLTR